MNASTFADDTTIDDNQVIWRRIYQVISDDNLRCKRPTSACFLQNGPLSVYIASEAISPQLVMEDKQELFLVALRVDFIRRLGLGIVRDSSSGGAGHALLLGRITRSMAQRMAKTATWVEPYAPEDYKKFETS